MISQRILFGFIEELCKNDRILKSILGQWKEDKKDGQGILTSSDGARYEECNSWMISQRILFGFIVELCKNDRIVK